MAEHRATRVSSRAIRLAITEGSFTASDIIHTLNDPPSESTVTRVLRQLEQDGWLERRAKNSQLWRAGNFARMLGDMGDSAIQEADRDPIRPGESSERTESNPFDF